MKWETPVTVRVPRELKDRVDTVAAELGISSSAVWKILLRRTVKPLLEEDGGVKALDIFSDQALMKSVPVKDAHEAGAGVEPGASRPHR